MSRSRIVVITGATSGIGKAIANAFSDTGAKLFLIGRNKRKMAAVTRTIPDDRVLGVALGDFALNSDIDSIGARVDEVANHVDVLIHAAGDYARTNLDDDSLSVFDTLFAVNVRAAYALTRRLLAHLERAHGQIIFLNSSVVHSTGAGVAAYKATKHALQGMADSLRQDLNARGIRVSSIYPGQTATPQLRRIYKHRGSKYSPAKLLSARDVAALAVTLTRLPKDMEVTDVRVRSRHRY